MFPTLVFQFGHNNDNVQFGHNNHNDRVHQERHRYYFKMAAHGNVIVMLLLGYNRKQPSVLCVEEESKLVCACVCECVCLCMSVCVCVCVCARVCV